MENKKEVICECFMVTRGEIENAIRENHLKTIDEVGYMTNAGLGCGQCKDKIQELLDRVNKHE